MQLNDTREIAAPRSVVWDGLLSADVLMACVPGCKEMTGNATDGFDAVVVQKVGPVKATFKGSVKLSDIIEGEALTLTGEGKGGAAGFAKGGAKVRLSDLEAGGTLLEYDVEAKVGGKLAQLGSRIIDGFSKKMADQFFERFQQTFESPAQEAEQSGEETNDDKEKKSWLGRVLGS